MLYLILVSCVQIFLPCQFAVSKGIGLPAAAGAITVYFPKDYEIQLGGGWRFSNATGIYVGAIGTRPMNLNYSSDLPSLQILVLTLYNQYFFPSHRYIVLSCQPCSLRIVSAHFVCCKNSLFLSLSLAKAMPYVGLDQEKSSTMVGPWHKAPIL